MNDEHYVYPVLGSVADLGLVRVSGAGLGNSFYHYFHAVRVAEEQGATLLRPAWHSIKPAAMLRGLFRSRRYGDLLRAHESERAGLAKLAALATCITSANRVSVDPHCAAPLLAARVNFVQAANFEFGLLMQQRDAVRKRLVQIAARGPSPEWGTGRFIGMHVRLGDFKTGTPGDVARGRTNTRLPMSYFVAVIKRMRAARPDLPIVLFSDGRNDELSALMDAGATRAKTSLATEDLLALASSSVLVASNSTFSRWAAFLGNMPSIWIRDGSPIEKPTDDQVPRIFLDMDGGGSLEELRSR